MYCTSGLQIKEEEEEERTVFPWSPTHPGGAVLLTRDAIPFRLQ